MAAAASTPLQRPARGEVLRVRTMQWKPDERLATLEPLRLQPATEKRRYEVVTVDPGVKYQTLLGFGTSMTESAVQVLSKLSPPKQQEVIDKCFRTDLPDSLGYSVVRIHMNSCDFSEGNWSCCETPDDIHLASFTIDRYRGAILPALRRAKAASASGSFTLFASPWSPPAWMKDTGKMCMGGRLKPECREAWARHYVRFAKALEEEGLPLWGFTVQNEPEAATPWENCLYSGEAERDFVRDFLGPALRDSGLGDLKVIVHDHNRDNMFARARAILSDPVAAQFVWGTAFHWYGDERYESWPAPGGMKCFENVQRVHDLAPEKHIIMSEACQERGPRTGDWRLGERYAESIIRDMNHWTEAWVDWNMVLDRTGGPNHVGNVCSAPIIVDAKNDAFSLQSSYYYIAHFSRFIVPGAQRILCGSSRDALEATAFENPDGTIVVVVLNQSDNPYSLKLELLAEEVKTDVPPHSITTFIMTAPAAVPRSSL
mmetsp:Transcript_59964/g.135622  ORF Transcript_59964/g.135622 Transcript_59964/m.135622 type:complete len:487 (-) Transcript_59964:38-1498(-)